MVENKNVRPFKYSGKSNSSYLSAINVAGASIMVIARAADRMPAMILKSLKI